MSKVSRDKKSEYNRSAYLKRKAKKIQASPEDKIDDLLLDDNVADIRLGLVQSSIEPSPEPVTETIPSEPEELEISQDDYNKFLQWKNSQTNREETKKKLEDPSYLLTVLKTLGVAVMPALIGVFQRAAMKTLEQKTDNPETRSANSMPVFEGTGSERWDPLSVPS